jgi:O-antigen/teichoic acid export membrane protein
VNKQASNIIKNFSYTLSSNLVSLIASTLVILIIPKLIGVQQYGYWQLYLFYSLYVGFLHFGWSDGVYLRYGGKEYKDLNKPLFFSQYYMFLILQFILVVTIVSVSLFYSTDPNRLFIFQMLAINLFFTNMKSMLLFVLQGTNRLKEYSKVTLIDRIIYSILIILFLTMGLREYELMIIADLTGKCLSFLYSIYFCKDIVFQRLNLFYFSIKEAIENITVGIKLMFANIASMLIIGVVRFGIERSWDVNTFAKVSLTLSISNFVLIFINTIGLVIFPILRRTSKKKLPKIYITIRDSLMVVLLGLLITYYPIKKILSLWLTQYSDSLIYLAFLFPMITFEGKTSLLINTYLKTLRKEKTILKVNLITLVISVFLTVSTTFFLRNLDYAVISIALLLAFRSILAEYYLASYISLSVIKDITLELLLLLVFIISAWYFDSWITPVIYGFSYLFYVYIKRKDLLNMIENVKALMKN